MPPESVNFNFLRFYEQFLRFYLVGKKGKLLYQFTVVVLRREVL